MAKYKKEKTIKIIRMEKEVPAEKHNEEELRSPEEGMDVFECIATRRSIRKFMNVDVPMELIGAIIDSGRYAPSSGNVQNWRFVIIKNKDTINKIAEGAMQQLWIADAPIIIIVCAETEKLGQFYGVRGERLYSIQNCAAAIQNMLLAAHALGLASCWIGAFDENIIKRITNVPEDVRIQAILPIGYPDEVVPAPMHFTLENVCYFETYGNRVINIDRVFQNPNVVGRVTNEVQTISSIGKDIIEKAKKKFSK
ncbi:nitroreductase family protein [Candidatus Woesearchaeota archaeon]|nr:nitroreductase family protein [Candidatus Woesearchaeota archaeon]